MSEHLSRDTWEYRAIEATRAHQSQLGCMLLAMLGRGRTKYPRFGRGATVTSDGYVMADFIGRDGRPHLGAFVCSFNEMVGNFRGLADHLKLSDADRTALFEKVRAWILVDYRPKHNHVWF